MAAQPSDDVHFYAPPEVEAGAYANAMQVWHTKHDFMLDFAVTERIEADSDEPESGEALVCRITSRVRVPATMIFDVIRSLNEVMTRYERIYGEIHRPGEERP